MRGEGLYLGNDTIELLSTTNGFLCTYVGVNTKELNEVREELKKVGFSIKIIRRKLAVKKVEGKLLTETEIEIESIFEGSTAIIMDMGSGVGIEERLINVGKKLEVYKDIFEIICIIYKKRLIPISYLKKMTEKSRNNSIENIMRSVIVNSYSLITITMKSLNFIKVREKISK